MHRFVFLLAVFLYSKPTTSAENIVVITKSNNEYVNAVYDIANDILSTYVRVEVCKKLFPESEDKRSEAYKNYQVKNQATMELIFEHYKLAKNVHTSEDPKNATVILKYNSDKLEALHDSLVNEFKSDDKDAALNRCESLYSYLNSRDDLLAMKYPKQINVINSAVFSVSPPKRVN